MQYAKSLNHIYKADLHIHTVLSPCGGLYMSPSAIIERATYVGLKIIGITDHNSTKHCSIAREIGRKAGIFVLMGVEITTREEVHCLAFFETDDQLFQMQRLIDVHLPNIKNKPNKFGYQVIVDEHENVIAYEEKLLISALDLDIDTVRNKVRQLNGIFILAHIDKSINSYISQLGFIPPDFEADALELSRHTTQSLFLADNKYLNKRTFIRNSDAHFIPDIGSVCSLLKMPSVSFANIKYALVEGNVG